MYMYFFFFIKLTFNSMGIQWVVNGTEESISCHLTPPNEVGTDGEVSRGTGCGGGLQPCAHCPHVASARLDVSSLPWGSGEGSQRSLSLRGGGTNSSLSGLLC